MSDPLVFVGVPASSIQRITRILGGGNMTSFEGGFNRNRDQNRNETTNRNQGPRSNRNENGGSINRNRGTQWTSNMIQRALTNSPKNVKKILRFMAERPGKQISAEEIGREININPFQVVEALGSFSDRIKNQYQIDSPPFNRHFEGKRAQYSISREIADHIQDV